MSTPDAPRRIVPKILLSLFCLTAAISLILLALGLAESRLLFYLGAAAVLILIASGAWEIVERRGDHGGVLPWIAFPVALLSFFGALPFLALAAYPPLGELFSKAGRVDAYVVQYPEGPRLEIRFPRAVRNTNAANLRFNDTALSAAYYEKHVERFRWIDARRVSIQLDPLTSDLELAEITSVLVNADSAAGFFHYEDGEKVPTQKASVRGD